MSHGDWETKRPRFVLIEWGAWEDVSGRTMPGRRAWETKQSCFVLIEKADLST